MTNHTARMAALLGQLRREKNGTEVGRMSANCGWLR